MELVPLVNEVTSSCWDLCSTISITFGMWYEKLPHIPRFCPVGCGPDHHAALGERLACTHWLSIRLNVGLLLSVTTSGQDHSYCHGWYQSKYLATKKMQIYSMGKKWWLTPCCKHNFYLQPSSSMSGLFRPPVCHTSFTLFLSLYHHGIFIIIDKAVPMQKVKVRGQSSRSQGSKQILYQFWLLRTITQTWIHTWLRNDAHRLK